MRLQLKAVMAGLAWSLVSVTAQAGFVTIDDAGIYSAESSDTGTFTYPQMGTFFVHLAGNINAPATGTIVLSGFPSLGVPTVELTAFNPSGSPGAHFVLAAAYFDNFVLSYRLSVDDAEYALIKSNAIFTLNPSNSDKVQTDIEYLPPGTGASAREFYAFDNDPYTITGSLSPRSLLPSVPLPASAPMFGAGLIALGAVSYSVKRKATAA